MKKLAISIATITVITGALAVYGAREDIRERLLQEQARIKAQK